MSDDSAAGDVGGQAPPTQEEIAAAFVQRLGRTPVRDIVMQTMATMTDVAGIRLGLGPEGDVVKDLEQARLAIESLHALMGVAEREIGQASARPFRDPLAQLQMAFAQIAEADGVAVSGGTEAGGAGPAAPGGAAAGQKPPDDPASRLWVPGR